MQLIKFAQFALKNSPSIKAKQMIEEMLPVAVATIGITENTGTSHWLQHVPSRQQAPDIRALYQKQIPKNDTVFHIIDIEVVTLGPHSSGDDIAKFILDTKLANPKKAYPRKTTIICHLNRKLSAIVNEVSEKLIAANKPNDVYLIGLVRGTRVYQFNRVNPKLSQTIIIDLNRRVPPQLPAIYALRKGTRIIPESQAPNPYF